MTLATAFSSFIVIITTDMSAPRNAGNPDATFSVGTPASEGVKGFMFSLYLYRQGDGA